MNDLLDWTAALASLVGAFFFLAGAVGLWRLPDFYTRTHAPTKAATLGILFMALGSILVHFDRGFVGWLENLLLVVFVFLTVPVSTQMLVRGATASGLQGVEQTRGTPPSEPIERV